MLLYIYGNDMYWLIEKENYVSSSLRLRYIRPLTYKAS